MTGRQSHRVSVPFFIGPDGERITLAQLPPRGLKRWLPRHKAMVVAAVRHGLLSFDEACKLYPPYAEEFLSWHSSAASARLQKRGR
jgi:Protein of unknown function (DUF1153)